MTEDRDSPLESTVSRVRDTPVDSLTRYSELFQHLQEIARRIQLRIDKVLQKNAPALSVQPPAGDADLQEGEDVHATSL